MAIRKRQKEEKRIRILEASARVFAKKGYSGAVIDDIAVEAGVGKGTVYEYFDSKEELFFLVFEWVAEKNSRMASVRMSALAGSASDRLKTVIDTVLNSWAELSDLYPLVLEFWSASASSKMRDRFKQAFRQAYSGYRLIIASLIRDGIERGEFRADIDAESFAAAFVGTWDALLLQAWFETDFDLTTTARNYMSVVMRGLAAS